MTVQDEIREELRDGLYGLMAEFATPDDLIAAAHKVGEAGYQKVDAFSPFPIEEVTEALGLHRSKLPIIVLLGGILGGLAGFALEYWSSVIEYPMNIGGRPFFSWQAFIVPMYECTILAASASAVFGMILLNRLPQPYHPVFNVPRFALASRDRYFLVIEAADPKFDERGTRTFLSNLNPSEVSDVAL
ncbi:MAG TPA: DUF3341 domain-containing protein [Thermoanaerobaculia bacterium]